MKSADMERLVQQLKAQEAAAEAEGRKAEIAAKLSTKNQLTPEQIRVRRLEAEIDSWLQAMKKAGYPGVKLIKAHLPVRERFDLLSLSKVTVWQTLDVAGWVIGNYSAVGTYVDGFAQISLTADGDLIASDDLWHGLRNDLYELGSDYQGYRHAEAEIPGNLAKLAVENGVNWQPTTT